MQRLLPDAAPSVALSEVYGPIPSREGRPWVRVTMVAGIDGATAVAGRSGGLSSPSDHALFDMQRSLADTVLVAGETMRAERYGPVELSPEEIAARRARGQSDVPPIAVVSRSLDFDWSSPFFANAVARPIMITVRSAPPDRRAAAEAVADIVLAGERGVEPLEALGALGARGVGAIAAEGGPTLNGLLAAAGAIDDICLSVSPLLAAGDSKRIVTGKGLDPPQAFALASACHEDGFLFLRYVRS